jgi:hypothetical protein
MERIKLFLKDNLLVIIGGIGGGVGGYLYWLKIGCTSGSCPITSSPLMSTIWGIIMGGLILSMFKRNEPQHKIQDDHKN